MISLNLFAQRELLHAHAQLFHSCRNQCVSVGRLGLANRFRRRTPSISCACHVFPSLLLPLTCIAFDRFELLAEVCFQQVQQLCVIHGFCQIVAAPARVPFLNVLFLSASSQQDHGDFLRLLVLFQHAASFQSGHPWHHDIHQDQVRLFPLRSFHRFFSIHGADEHVI